MTPTPLPAGPASFAPAAFASRSDFRAALQWGLQRASAVHARTVWWCDPDFAEWPLDDPAWLETLGAWLRLPQRRLVLLAVGYDVLQRRHPRFVLWRRGHAHAVDARIAPDEAAPDLPTVLVADRSVSVQLLDRTQWRGRSSDAERDAVRWRERLDAVLQQSEPGFPVNHLGL